MGAKRVFKCCARGSRLSAMQAREALSFMASRADGFHASLRFIETPGDRDLSTPIEKAAPDFFTRDLDDAVKSGAADFSIHSAKDLPQEIGGALDWFWLPGGEDARDCLVFRNESVAKRSGGKGLKIGVSSTRREKFAKKLYPNARILPMRGAVDKRVDSVAKGEFDIAVMAMAGLNRLFPGTGGMPVLDTGGRILPVRPIPLCELPVPEGQGRIAIVFRKGDGRMEELRRNFVKAVRFTGAGIGNPGTITVRGLRDLETADVVIADSLSGFGSTHGGKAVWIDAGKRCGRHSKEQHEITRLLCDEARKGRRVVRLKGGDAGIFGRLAEETEALDALGIPYHVRPGVGAFSAAAAPNGMFLTKRGEAAGFAVSTPRSDGGLEPHVHYMASGMAKEILKTRPPEEPYAMVWDAAGPYEEIDCGLCGKPRIGKPAGRPGILITGFAGSVKRQKRVLLACSEDAMPDAVLAFEDRGFRIVEWPMVKTVARAGADRILADAVAGSDAIVLASPGAVRIFFSHYSGDVRKLPEIWVCGPGTAAALARRGIRPDVIPAGDYSAKGLVAALKDSSVTPEGMRVARLRGSKAGPSLSRALRRLGVEVRDCVFYDTLPLAREGKPPPCEAVFFASASAVEAFAAAYGAKALRRKELYAIGEPTRAALRRIAHADCRIAGFVLETAKEGKR